MVQLIAVIISIASIIWSFFNPIMAWIPIGLLVVVLLFILIGTMVKKWRYVEELSPDANEMLAKFGTYYLMPFAGTDFSSACSTLQFGGIIVGIVGCFGGFWWGLVPSAVTYLVMGPAAVKFNPTVFIQSQPLLVMAHNEVIDWILNRNHNCDDV